MKQLFNIILLLITLSSCSDKLHKYNYSNCVAVPYKTEIPQRGALSISLGGFGSSMAYNQNDSCFYLLTDRGPNIDGLTPESKIFPIIDYTPTIGQFKLKNDSLVLIRKIILKDSLGRRFVGLPNKNGDGITGEVAYNLKGEIIDNKLQGIDPEGLSMADDGTFWVSDEYAPFIMHFDKFGNMLNRLSPSNGLPNYLSKRRPNRGMEGLTISKDGSKLIGIMQSPLYFPDNSTKDKSINNRIIEISIDKHKTREFLYQMENPMNVVSEISCINDSLYLVLERDDKFPIKGKGFKKVFLININNATDISGIIVENKSNEELKQNKIYSVRKELFKDILLEIPDYDHDKPEGISLINDSVLCVVNDDDFGIQTSKNGRYIHKIKPNGKLDRNMIYFIPLKNKIFK